MTADISLLLRQARGDWLRAQAEVGHIRMLLAGVHWIETLTREEKYSPDQPRVPAGNSGGGQWTSDGGSAGEVQLAQNRGSGTYRVGNYNFEATPAQIMRLSNVANAANGAVARVREIDPNWRPRPGIYESAEGAISHQLGVEAEANARFNELRRDAIPGTSHNWGINRLRKELTYRGFSYKRATRDPGMLLENIETEEQVRIMRRPPKGPSKTEPMQKFYFEHYYRYRTGRDQGWGEPVPIPDKIEMN